MSKLYLVATPIGNLQDISMRALDTLRACDVIACEDTRHSKILLDKYDIRTKLIAYHKFNEKNSTEGIIKLLKEGKNVALISDAGMPIVCDPGSVLVSRLVEENIEYTVIPGANAMLCALVLSSFDTSSFAFFGFLSEKNKERNNTLKEISNFKGVSCVYSSKYNINRDLIDLFNALGERDVAVVSEISKVYEKVLRMNLKEASIEEPAGEYVIVIDKPKITTEINEEDLIKQVKSLVESGESVMSACKIVSKENNTSKRELYNAYIKENK